MTDSPWVLHHGDCLELLKSMDAESIDSIVTDPPAGILFMSKSWDSDKGSRQQWVAWMESIAVECLRVLKPGGHALVWALPRTSHWTGWAWENAGWEVRDKIVALFGCLSEDTEILVNGRWEPYQKAVVGSLALCYDVEHDTFAWHEIQETYCYPYDDTAFRIQSDRTDQIVSRAHRCLVERDGKFSFSSAETLVGEENVPILENLQGLLTALCLPHEGASGPQQDVPWVQSQADVVGEEGEVPYTSVRMPKMQQGIPFQESFTRSQSEVLLQHLQSTIPDARPNSSRKDGQDSQAWACGVDGRESEILSREDDRSTQSSLEGRGDVLQEARKLQRSEVHSLSNRVPSDGSEGWLRDGTSDHSGDDNRSLSSSDGDGASRGPRSHEQCPVEPGVVQVESGSQTVRASRFTTSDLARITPFHLTGKVWCVKTPTGAFVARRNGKVFITGNSGFPKSLDVSKAIDKAGGSSPVEQSRLLRERREARGLDRAAVATAVGCTEASVRDWEEGRARVVGAAIEFITPSEEYRTKLADFLGYSTDERRISGVSAVRTSDGTVIGLGHSGTLREGQNTDAAKQWSGWGTALKPAGEDWWVFRKPLIGTVAANVLAHGTGGINIDGCRIGTTKRVPGSLSHTENAVFGKGLGGHCQTGEESGHNPNVGRWPANVVLECTCDNTLPGPPDIVSDRVGEPTVAARYTECGATNIAVTPGERRSGGGVIHTNPECPAAMLDEQTGMMKDGVAVQRNGGGQQIGGVEKRTGSGSKAGVRTDVGFGGSGGASRFFYCAKASRSERTHGGQVVNLHPTVKPISLMRWLVRLITPPGGTVLDPFTGSGSTGVAAILEGFLFVGCEKEVESVETSRSRLEMATLVASGGVKNPWEDDPREVTPIPTLPSGPISVESMFGFGDDE